METKLILSTLECKLLPLQTLPCSGNWPQYSATKSPTLSSMCSGWMSCKARLGVTASWPRLHGSSAHVFVLKLAQDAVYRGWLFLGVSRSGWRGLGWWGRWHETRECYKVHNLKFNHIFREANCKKYCKLICPHFQLPLQWRARISP